MEADKRWNQFRYEVLKATQSWNIKLNRWLFDGIMHAGEEFFHNERMSVEALERELRYAGFRNLLINSDKNMCYAKIGEKVIDRCDLDVSELEDIVDYWTVEFNAVISAVTTVPAVVTVVELENGSHIGYLISIGD